MTKLIVLDTETGVHNRGEDAIGKMAASPWHPLNHIIYLGAKDIDKGTYYVSSPTYEINEPQDVIYIGQNIKFDLHYLMKDVEGFREFSWPICQIWDTMLAEYILTGQVSQYASLDKLSEKYGGTLKDDQVKEFWDEGYDTEDIPKEILLPYLENDVLNTEIVFKAQLKLAKELGMLELIKVQMNALKATTEMEWNGMHFDTEVAKLGASELRDEQDRQTFIMDLLCRSSFTEEFFDLHLKYTSPAHIATLLFGGEYKYTTKIALKDQDTGQPIQYKSGAKKGQTKLKNLEMRYETSGFNVEVKESYKTAGGKLGTSDDVLKDILKSSGNPIVVDFINALLAFRKANKDISTYFEGYSKLTWPDDIIHHGLNHVGTGTGRLSSSKPNLQNVSGKEED